MEPVSAGKGFWARAVGASLALALCLPPALPALGAVRKPAAANAPELLTLEQAIRKALSRGFTNEQARLNLRQAEITHDNAFDTMFTPGVSIKLNSVSNYSVGNVPSDRGRQVGNTENYHGYPASSAGLTLGSYTLFNFWKDWIEYEKARLDYARAKETFEESTRQIRFDVTKAFYQTKNQQERLEASQRSVAVAQAIVDLVSSRIKLGRATQDDLSSSQLDLVNAKKDRDQAETDLKQAIWTLDIAMGDPPDTRYVIQDSSQARYRPVKFTPEAALKLYEDRAPTLKSALKEVKRAELDVKLQEKNRLPLPKVTFSGINLTYGNSYYGNKASANTDAFSGRAAMDITTTLDFTLPLTGPGGLFGGRTVETAEITLDLNESRLRETRLRDHVNILSVFQQIKQTEEVINNNKTALDSASRLLDNLFRQVSANPGQRRLELRDAIQQARDSELSYSESVTQHLTLKLDLAALIGVDKLPGEP
jgi:outer membrane protein TolC